MTDSVLSITSILKRTALFSALSDAELESLAACTLIRSYASGVSVFSEGAPCIGLYIVSKGRVRIFKTSPSGREQVLALEGPGCSIAELPVFDGGPYPASAAAVGPSDLLFIARKDFRALCMECPEIALKVLQVAGARLRRLVGIIEELSFTTVRHRLVSWILRHPKNEDGCSFTLDASHQELAAQIGTVRELVSRNLARLQAQEFISINDHQVTVLNPEGLEAELSSVI
ncbi:MAG: Crp/Fnr family transcriptional regulator [Isosphaeraceae bacterium]